MSKNYTNAMTSLKTVIHDTSFLDAQKISVNPGNGNFDERIDVGSNLRNVSIINHELKGIGYDSTFTTNITGNTENANITGIQFSKKHFITGDLKSISFPYEYNSSAANGGYLVLQIFGNDTEIIKTYYSDNISAFNSNTSSPQTTFTFTGATIPFHYKFVRFALVSSNSINPTISSGTNCLKFRVKLAKINANYNFDDDECKVYNGSTENNWLVAINVNYIAFNNGLISEVENISSEIDNLKNKKVIDGIFEKTSPVETIDKPSNTSEGDAAVINSDKLPINIPIRSICIPLASSISYPVDIILIRKTSSNTRSLISRSSNSVEVTGSMDAVWNFSEPFVINEGDSLEIFAVKKDFVINGLEIPHPGFYLNWYSTSSGTDSARYGNVWYNNSRNIHLIFNTITESRSFNEVIDEIRTESESYASKDDLDELKETIEESFTPHIEDNTIHINEAEHSELSSLIEIKDDIALTNKENVFTENLILDGELTSNKSINIIGGNIFIAKGSQISFLDDGEVTITNGATGYPIYNGIPSIVSNGAIYNVGSLESDTNLSAITFDGDETLVQSCEIWFTTGSTIYNITWSENVYWIDYDDGSMPTLLSNMKYRIVLRREIDDIIASISHYYAVR